MTKAEEYRRNNCPAKEFIETQEDVKKMEEYYDNMPPEYAVRTTVIDLESQKVEVSTEAFDTTKEALLYFHEQVEMVEDFKWKYFYSKNVFTSIPHFERWFGSEFGSETPELIVYIDVYDTRGFLFDVNEW